MGGNKAQGADPGNNPNYHGLVSQVNNGISKSNMERLSQLLICQVSLSFYTPQPFYLCLPLVISLKSQKRVVKIFQYT